MSNNYRNIILVVLLLVPLTSMGKEISQGSTRISGQTSLALASSELSFDAGGSVDTSATEAKVGMSYFAVDNLGIGITYVYESTEVKVDTNTATSSTTIVGPSASYNVSLNNNVSLSPSVFLGYANITTGATGSEDQVITGFGYGAGVELHFFVNDNVFMGAGVQYISLGLEDDLNNKADQSSFAGALGFGILLP